jgi:hypothetical protein
MPTLVLHDSLNFILKKNQLDNADFLSSDDTSNSSWGSSESRLLGHLVTLLPRVLPLDDYSFF